MSLTSLLIADLTTPLYLGLFAQDPVLVHDPLTVELVGPSYVRPMISWTPSGNTLVHPTTLLFTGIPAGTSVAAMGVLDDYANGHLLFSEPFAVPYHFTKGGSLLFDSLTLTLPN